MPAFDRSGPAALGDLATPEWQELFAMLEEQQDAFLAQEERFRSPGYPWPRDPLHTWSRAWEYPFVFHRLRQWRQQWQGSGTPQVADIGSGVTFFPFAIAGLDCRVTCCDTDRSCAADLERAAGLCAPAAGAVRFRGAAPDALPFADAEVDAVYCISVLEHVPDFENTVREMARIVRPGGPVLLTVDLDLSGRGELSEQRHRDLLDCVDRHLQRVGPWRTVPANEQLTTRRGPYPLPSPRGPGRWWFEAKQAVKRTIGLPPRQFPDFCLAVEGIALQRQVH